MVDVSIVIASLALLVAVLSFVVSVFTYVRDRSRVAAWSEVISYIDPLIDPLTEQQKRYPVLHVSVMNVGRRPRQVRSLVMRSGKCTWSTSLKELEASTNPNEDLQGFVDEINRNRVAHISSVRLNEGEIFERTFQVQECTRFMNFQEDPFVEAEDLYIQDVQGKRYKVRESRKNLKQMLDALHASHA